jgi:hypothetical protein
MKHLFIGGSHDGHRREVPQHPSSFIVLQKVKPQPIVDINTPSVPVAIETEAYSPMTIMVDERRFIIYHRYPMSPVDVMSMLIDKYPKPKCNLDTDNDGNCHNCFNRGGCENVGGPFH